MARYKSYFFLHLLILLTVVSGIFSKLAAGTDFLSIRFILFYSLVILFLFIYALGWQQVLKKIPLTTAYCNKAISIVWAMLFGFLLFGETVTVQNIIGAIIVFVGIYLVVTSDE